MHDRYFQSRRNGLWIYQRTWTPSGSSKGVIYLIHGYITMHSRLHNSVATGSEVVFCSIGEHCGRYDHVANALCKAGYLVHALDHQGHGQSHGTRCYFEQFSHLVDDVVQFVISVKPPPAGIPAFILGHSMGGLVALHVARRPEIAAKLQGLIISGPALIFDPEIDSPVNRFLAQALSNIVPKVFHTYCKFSPYSITVRLSCCADARAKFGSHQAVH
jgi:acylglycerol lipase